MKRKSTVLELEIKKLFPNEDQRSSTEQIKWLLPKEKENRNEELFFNQKEIKVKGSEKKWYRYKRKKTQYTYNRSPEAETKAMKQNKY